MEVQINDCMMLNDILLLRPIFRESPIVAVGDANDTLYAEVLAVGPGVKNYKTGKRMPVDIKVGEVVVLDYPAIKDSSDYHIYVRVDGELLICKSAKLIQGVVYGELVDIRRIRKRR